MKLPIFLDVEASSLSGDSYPIEIAWNFPSGQIESHLINPYLYPENYTDWSPDSQAIHGLSREYLMSNGKSPELVATKMIESLSGIDIYTNAPDFDGFWVRRLFDAVDMDMPFKFKDSLQLFNCFCPNPYKHEKLARSRAGGVHRATYDVKYLVEMYHLCIGIS